MRFSDWCHLCTSVPLLEISIDRFRIWPKAGNIRSKCLKEVSGLKIDGCTRLLPNIDGCSCTHHTGSNNGPVAAIGFNKQWCTKIKHSSNEKEIALAFIYQNHIVIWQIFSYLARKSVISWFSCEPWLKKEPWNWPLFYASMQLRWKQSKIEWATLIT